MSAAFGLMVVLALLTRVVIMFVVNYFIFTYIGPVIFGIDYLGFGQFTLLKTLGIQYSGTSLLTTILLFTSAFNMLHTLFSVMVPYVILAPLSVRVPQIASGHPWISRFITS
jgi:hypothetical protein